MRLSTVLLFISMLIPVPAGASKETLEIFVDDGMLRWSGPWRHSNWYSSHSINGVVWIPGMTQYSVDASAHAMSDNSTSANSTSVNSTSVDSTANSTSPRVPVASLDFDFVGDSLKFMGLLGGGDDEWLASDPVVITVDGKTLNGWRALSNGSSPATNSSLSTRAPSTTDLHGLPQALNLDLLPHHVHLDVYDGVLNISRISFTTTGLAHNAIQYMPRTDEYAVTTWNDGPYTYGVRNDIFQADNGVQDTVSTTNGPYDFLSVNGTVRATLPPLTAYVVLVGIAGEDFGPYNLTINPAPPYYEDFNPTDTEGSGTWNITAEGWSTTQTAKRNNTRPVLAQMFLGVLWPAHNYTIQVDSDAVGIHALHLWSANGRNETAWDNAHKSYDSDYTAVIAAITVPIVVVLIAIAGLTIWYRRRRRLRKAAAAAMEDLRQQDAYAMAVRKRTRSSDSESLGSGSREGIVSGSTESPTPTLRNVEVGVGGRHLG